MSTIALTRPVSPSLLDCELTFLERQPIDLGCAAQQHRAYQHCLRELGIQVLSLPAAPELPDAVFVEDTAVVLDEVAVITRPGAASRRLELDSVSRALAEHRSLEFVQPPATLDGGDVVHAGRTLLVGHSPRTNAEGISQLQEHVAQFGYEARSVPVLGCAHLKSACSLIGENTLLVTPEWIDVTALAGFELLQVAASEPWAANALLVGDTVVLAHGFPETRTLLEKKGTAVTTVDISEFHKAEAGLSCLSIVLESN